MSAGSPIAVPPEPVDADLVREQAWIGDAVLALFAREWLLINSPPDADRSDLFRRMTCNQFLSGLGEPTRVEARIGRVYQAGGLQAAYAWIEAQIIPLYLKQSLNRDRSHRRTRR